MSTIQSLSEALSFVRAAEASKALAGVTLQTSMAEAIIELDSSQEDGTSTTTSSDALYQASSIPLGKLQRIKALRDLLLGTTEQEGLFDTLRNT